MHELAPSFLLQILDKLLFGGQRPLAISLPTLEYIQGRASPGDQPGR